MGCCEWLSMWHCLRPPRLPRGDGQRVLAVSPLCCSGSPAPREPGTAWGHRAAVLTPSVPQVPLQGPVLWLPPARSREEGSCPEHVVLLRWHCTNLSFCHLHCCHVGERKGRGISPFQQGFSAPAKGQRDGAPWKLSTPPDVGTNPLHCCSLAPCPVFSLWPCLSLTAEREGGKTNL